MQQQADEDELGLSSAALAALKEFAIENDMLGPEGGDGEIVDVRLQVQERMDVKERTHDFRFTYGDDGDDEQVCITLTGVNPELGQTLASTGLTVWRAAQEMARFMWEHRKWFVGRSVVELGAGLGLCGVLASKLCTGGTVVITDGGEEFTDSALDALRLNLEKNSCNLLAPASLLPPPPPPRDGEGHDATPTTAAAVSGGGGARVALERLTWGEHAAFLERYGGFGSGAAGDGGGGGGGGGGGEVRGSGGFDYIVAADVIYEEEAVSPLLHTVVDILRLRQTEKKERDRESGRPPSSGEACGEHGHHHPSPAAADVPAEEGHRDQQRREREVLPPRPEPGGQGSASTFLLAFARRNVSIERVLREAETLGLEWTAEEDVLRAFKREMMEQRAIIIKALSEVSAFGPLDVATLEHMADGTSERDVPAGEVVAAQDALATEFFIVVSGVIRVSRRAALAEGVAGRDEEVNRLLAGSNFGAGELLAGEHYSTTYQAEGPVTLAVMSADEFHACTDRAIVNKSNTSAGGGEGQSGSVPEGGDAGDAGGGRRKRNSVVGDPHPDRVANAVNRVPIFAPLSLEQKRLVSNALLEVHFRPGLYICEEGKPGSSFHIITSGTCRVTIHDPNAPGQQREVTKLHQDDFFGEVALIESGLRTATVVAETDVTCLSLTRRHFDMYLKPIKAAIVESAAAKELQVLQLGEDEMDDEMDDDFDKPDRSGTRDGPANGGGKETKGDRSAGDDGSAETKGFRNYRNPRKGARRRKRINSFRVNLGGGAENNEWGVETSSMHVEDVGCFPVMGQGVATHALRVQKRTRINFYDRFTDDLATPLSPAKAWRRMVVALENDVFAMLLDEMIDRPTGLPECNKIVSKVLSKDLRRWDVAYDLIRDVARNALGKASTRLKDGELAVLSGLFRLHPHLRQRYCADWPEYQWAEICKRMRLEQVRSLDKVYVHGAHGTKCYFLLRGLARVLMPENDPTNPGGVCYRYDADIGPGELFGDDVLDGSSETKKRNGTVIAVTDCEFAVLEASDYSDVRDRGLSQMTLDDKCNFLKSVAMMKASSTYRLYKIALLVNTDDAVKDSVILRSDEPSKALYFIVSGTVEVIQLKKKRVRNRTTASTGAGNTTGPTNGSGGCGAGAGGGTGGAGGSQASADSPREVDGGAAEFVYKTARRVLTVLESGEYFGESGVLTYFNGGSKASSTATPLTEQFCFVARTSVEMLVLRRKHFNFIEIPMLEILKANHHARLQWRAQRKQEAHRGRAVLRAAKRALGQAAVRVRTLGGDQLSQLHRGQQQPQTTASVPGSFPYEGLLCPSVDGSGGGDAVALLAQPRRGREGPGAMNMVGRPHGGGCEGLIVDNKKYVHQGGIEPELRADKDREGGSGGDDAGAGGDDVSLAGLSLASGDSMQYSVDSGWLPNLPGTGGPSSAVCGGGDSSTGFPSLDEEQHKQPERLQGLQSGGLHPEGGDGYPSGLLGNSFSLPILGVPAGLGGKGAAGRGQDYYQGLEGKQRALKEMSSGLDVQEILASARDVALDLSTAAVSSFESRCIITRVECEGLHYSACRSRLPGGECTDTGLCSEAECGSVRDFSNPVVQIPKELQGADGSVTNPDVIETVCYGISLDRPLVQRFEDSQSPDSVSSAFTYFGSWTGVFRIFPGAHYAAECGDYDPRIRPWYVAASSGPKDVVIVVDISASMKDNGRFILAKDAVQTVLGTMNEHTFVNIVLFESEAKVITSDGVLVPASDENTDMLLGLLAEVEPRRSTNFEAAMTTTFNLLEESQALGESASSGCTTAILLLTDGTITEGLGHDDPSKISTLVKTLNADIEAQIFTFALGPEADAVTLKTIACGSDGISQSIPDGGALSTAMSFYYRSVGKAESEFSDGTGGELGFTVASPAYDQAFDPPAFLGVSGVDFTVQSFLDLGFTEGEVEDAVFLGGRDCPDFNLTSCQLQQFRGSISAESVCDDTVSCTSGSTSLEPVRCMEEEEYPDYLWENVDLAEPEGGETMIDTDNVKKEPAKKEGVLPKT
eukprot:g11286.t1